MTPMDCKLPKAGGGDPAGEGAEMSDGARRVPWPLTEPRTPAQKRHAVQVLLADPDWAKCSHEAIARQCGVSAALVGDVRRGYRRRPSSRSSTVHQGANDRAGNARSFAIDRANVAQSIAPKNLPPRRMPADRTPAAVQVRRARIRAMAAEGYGVAHIAQVLDIAVESCRAIIRKEQIDVPAARSLGRTHRHDANRIVTHMVTDAENLTADVGLIDFGRLDRARLDPWIAALGDARRSLEAFIRRLVKERASHEGN